MPPPEAPPGPSVSVVVVVGGSCVLRYSRPPPPPPAPSPPPAWGQPGDPRGERGELLVLLRSLGPGAPPEPVAATSFVGPEPRDLLPAAPELRSPSSAGGGLGHGLGWPQDSPPFAVELPRGPGGFGFSLRGGPAGVFVRGLREGGPAQRCGCIQVSDELLAINGAPTAGMSHAQALARIRGGGSRLRLLLRRPHGAPPAPLARGGAAAVRGQLPAGGALLLPRGGAAPLTPRTPHTDGDGAARFAPRPPPPIFWCFGGPPSRGGHSGTPRFGGGALRAMQYPPTAFRGSHGGVVPLPISGCSIKVRTPRWLPFPTRTPPVPSLPASGGRGAAHIR
ncbi:PDZ domain-containing protein MAGIX [Haemorhous mexicanus]|uniref:PDZ domain-containing protein MAGIX n=1 Tax=Haemorhous mexicanus TaxID=30427 RepID=UPI0028BF24CC|nr:PDZ domain-containing protein MAGIX [Haemorhous mexicanus]